MKEFIHGTDAQFASVKNKLDNNPGKIYRYSGLQLNSAYTPSTCSLLIGRVNDGFNREYHMELEPDVTGPSDTVALTYFLANGLTGSFSDIRNAFNTFLRPMAAADAAPPSGTGEGSRPGSGSGSDSGSGSGSASVPEVEIPENVEDPNAAPKTLDREKLLRSMKARIIGHESSIEAVCRYVSNHSRKVNVKRPVSILIGGETGSGKTATVEALQEAISAQLGDCKLIRLNMNELKDASSVSRLTGSNPGYVGYGDKLVFEPLLDYEGTALVLFDEIEKAHSDVDDVIMQIIDTGELRLASPRNGKDIVSFKKCMLFFTTNLSLNPENSAACTEETMREALASHFRPEFVGRIQHIIAYARSTYQERIHIAAKSLGDLAREYGLRLVKAPYQAILPLIETKTAFGNRVARTAADDLYGDLFAEAHDNGLTDVEMHYHDENDSVTVDAADQSERR